MTSLVIEHGAEVNAVSNCGDTPLHRACRLGRGDTASVLIRNSKLVLTAAHQRLPEAMPAGLPRMEHDANMGR